MIKIVDSITTDTDVEVSVTPQIKTYNIVTGCMSDDCKPYRVAQSAMMWISENGCLGEIECIYPIVVEDDMCSFRETTTQFTGFPVFEIISCDNEAYIQNKDNGFVIWFNKSKEIDTEILFEQLSFLISEKELVGIICKEYISV